MFILEEKLFQLKLIKVEKLVWNARVATKMMSTVNGDASSAAATAADAAGIAQMYAHRVW